MAKGFAAALYRRSEAAKRQERQSRLPPSYGTVCPHFPRCIGCPLINVPYPEQLTRKRNHLARAFSQYRSLVDIAVPPVTASPHRLGYRGRVKLVVRSASGKVATGLYVPGTHRVIDISSCPVHPRPVQQVTQYLKKKIVEAGILPYDERNDTGQLRYLDFRYSFARRELSVTLVTRHRDFPQGLPLARSLTRKFSFITAVIQNINEQRGNVIWGNSQRILSGRDSLVEQIGALKLAFPAGVFSQANPSTAKKIYDTVTEMAALGGRETVLDLYCGVGPLSLYLARSVRLVVGIDESSLAIATAKQNARRNGLPNCRFFSGEVAAETADATKAAGRIDTIVLNPPRKGVQPGAFEAMLSLRVPKIIYVSCAPDTLARDLDRLVSRGYAVGRLQPFDMFPQTEQVETVALLFRSIAPELGDRPAYSQDG